MTKLSIPCDRSLLAISAETRSIYRINEPMPTPGEHEVLIKVSAAGLNRADLLQCKGLYEPPPSASAIPGLEVAGTVVATGPGVGQIKPGDHVCALTEGNGFSDYAITREGYCFNTITPDNAVFAAFPEALFTAWHNLFQRCKLLEGENLLIHGGSNGIGVIAIQLASLLGARVYTTAGSDEKRKRCLELGACEAVDYQQEEAFNWFADKLSQRHGHRGMDVILDITGGDFMPSNLKIAAMDGRICSIAFLRGASTSLSIPLLMAKRLTLTGSMLRPMTTGQKSCIADEIRAIAWPLVLEGRIRPVIDSRFAFSEAGKALERMSSGQHTGKILLYPD